MGEVGVGHLQVVLGRDPLGVADPVADDVNWKLTRQLCFASCPQVVKKLRPAWNTGPLQDAQELGPQVRVSVPVAAYNVDRPIGG